MTPAAVNRFTERSFGCPSPSETAKQCGHIDTRLPAPLTEISRNAIQCDKTRTPCVKRLFGLSSPATIRWFVVAVVVDAVDGVSRSGSPSHILKEMSETITSAPSLADRDSPGTVVTVSPNARVIAASNHPGPASIFGGSGSSMAQALGSPKAATGLGAHLEKALGRNFGLVATVANTAPYGTVECLADDFHGDELAKSPSLDVRRRKTLGDTSARLSVARSQAMFADGMVIAAVTETATPYFADTLVVDRFNNEATETLSRMNWNYSHRRPPVGRPEGRIEGRHVGNVSFGRDPSPRREYNHGGTA